MCATLGLVAGAFAQNDDVTRIQTAYENLRTFNGLEVQVSATQQIGQLSTSYTSDVYWYWGATASGQSIPKLISTEYRNGAATNQTVGDGSTLWLYNPARNEYLAHTYSPNPANAGTANRLDLLQHFNYESDAPVHYAARLLREIYGDDNALFRSWDPQSSVTVLTAGSENDPLTGQNYTPTETRDFVMYETPNTRSTVFERSLVSTPDGTSEWVIRNVYIARRDKLAGQDRLLEVQLTPTAQTTAPPSGTFSFKPPVGSKPLQGSAPGAG